MSGDPRPAGHRPANLGGEMVAIEVVLLHDGDHESIQPGALLVGNVLGGHDQDGDPGGLGPHDQRVDHVEAADLRHQQVQDDQVGQFGARGLDRLAAAVGALDGAGQPQQPDRDQLHRLRIVVDHEDLEIAPLRQRVQAQIEQRFVELLPRDRLLHDRRGAEREALVAIGDDRDDHDRDAPDVGNLFQAVEKLPAVHVGKHDVQRDQREPLLYRDRQRRLGGSGMQDGEAFGLELDTDQVGRLVVVFHDQRQPVARRHVDQ